MAGADPKRPTGGGSTRDRLSALPDQLLHRVLSFLPALEVVRTTVLSRRWTNLWLDATAINLDLEDFRRDHDEESKEGWNRMEDFANNLLMLHRAPCLDSFRLRATCRGDDQRRHVDTWVRRAIKSNPLVLELDVVTSVSTYQLPYLGSSPCRRLTKLHLIGISLDHSFAKRLHSWWPDLKDLTLEFCDTGFCGIESDKLENLVLQYSIIQQPADVFPIRAPHLTSLCVRGIPFSLDVGNSLVRASITLKPGVFSPRSVATLLGRLINVTCFELEGFRAMAALDEEFDEVPIFHSLTTLSLGWCFMEDLAISDLCKFKALCRSLHKFPNLEKLTLKNFEVVSVVKHAGFPVLENLRTLCLYSCKLHFQLLLHCLWNSPNLEKLTLCHCKLSDDSTGGKGKAKSKQTYSQSRNMARFQCLKPKCIEIVHYKDHAGVPELVSFFMDIAAPSITITDISVKCPPA